jgi:hypothetical protein
MNTLDRRQLLTTAAGAGAAVSLGRWLEPAVAAADIPKQRITIGQIGTGHELLVQQCLLEACGYPLS